MSAGFIIVGLMVLVVILYLAISAIKAERELKKALDDYLADVNQKDKGE